MQLLPVVTKEPVALMEYVNVLKGNKELIARKTNLPHHQMVNVYQFIHQKSIHPFTSIKIGLILLTTGRTLVPSDSAASQVVNALDSSSTCQDMPDYPIAVHQAGGGILDNVPIVCGGGSDDHGMQSSCYKLDQDTLQWTLLTDAFPAINREA